MPNTFTVTGTAASAPLWLPGHKLVDVIEEIARVFGLFQRTATGGSASTIVDSTMTRFADDYWINTFAYIKTTTDAADPQAEERFVTDFASSSGTITVSHDFTAAVGAGDVYQLYKYVSREALKRITYRVIAGVEVASTLIPSNSTLDYILNCTGLYRRQQMLHVFVRSHNDVKTMPIRVMGWELEDAEGILTLRMPYLLNTDDGFWITYTMGEGEEDGLIISSEDYRVNLPLQLMRARGVVYALEELITIQDMMGIEKFGRLLTYWTGELQRQENMYQRPVRKTHGFPWYLHFGDNASRAEEALGLT